MILEDYRNTQLRQRSTLIQKFWSQLKFTCIYEIYNDFSAIIRVSMCNDKKPFVTPCLTHMSLSGLLMLLDNTTFALLGH